MALDAAAENARPRGLDVAAHEVLRWPGVPPMFAFRDPIQWAGDVDCLQWAGRVCGQRGLSRAAAAMAHEVAGVGAAFVSLLLFLLPCATTPATLARWSRSGDAAICLSTGTRSNHLRPEAG